MIKFPAKPCYYAALHASDEQNTRMLNNKSFPIDKIFALMIIGVNKNIKQTDNIIPIVMSLMCLFLFSLIFSKKNWNYPKDYITTYITISMISMNMYCWKCFSRENTTRFLLHCKFLCVSRIDSNLWLFITLFSWYQVFC